MPHGRKTAAVVSAAIALTGAAAVTLPSSAAAMSGGVPAHAQNAPWMASILYNVPGDPAVRHQCGGTLITPDRVLTAAHCVVAPFDLPWKSEPVPIDPVAYQVQIGAAPLSAPAEVRRVTAIAIHPDFRVVPSPSAPEDPDAASGVFDAAVLQLSAPVTDVRPAQLARSTPTPGTPIELYGHGWTPEGGKPDELQHATLTTITHDDCAAQTPAVVDPESVFCAEADGVNGGFGDSGSPAVTRSADGTATVAGVFSFGTETRSGEQFAPGFNAFTDASAIRDFVLAPDPGWSKRWPEALLPDRSFSAALHDVTTAATSGWSPPSNSAAG